MSMGSYACSYSDKLGWKGMRFEWVRYVNDAVAFDIHLLSIYSVSDNGISVFTDGNIFGFTAMK